MWLYIVAVTSTGLVICWLIVHHGSAEYNFRALAWENLDYSLAFSTVFAHKDMIIIFIYYFI